MAVWSELKQCYEEWNPLTRQYDYYAGRRKFTNGSISVSGSTPEGNRCVEPAKADLPDAGVGNGASGGITDGPGCVPTEDVGAQPHYTRLDPQPLEIISKWGLDFALGNALKYIARAGNKPGASREQDIRKAIFYLKWAIGEQQLAK